MKINTKDLAVGLGLGAGIYLVTEYIQDIDAEAAILTTRPVPPPTGPGIVKSIVKGAQHLGHYIIKRSQENIKELQHDITHPTTRPLTEIHDFGAIE